MDIFSHALAGACAGLLFNKPLLGAVIAVVPDLALGIKRKHRPSSVYDFTHSLLFVLLAVVGAWLTVGAMFAMLTWLCLLSHLFLDVPTHGKQWAPPLLFPFFDYRVSAGEEWEFFNASWKRGFVLTILWCAAACTALLF